MYKLIVADDHPMTLLGTETFLKSLKYHVVGAYPNGISCLNGILQHLPDIAIIDVSMPGMSGLEILSIVKFRKLPTKVILLTMHKELSVFLRARDSQFDGYILKDNAEKELNICIQQIMKGQIYFSPEFNTHLTIDEQPNKAPLIETLTAKELKVLELVALHKTNKEIGEFLFISEKTVESHKQNIVTKLSLPKGKNVLLQWALKNLPLL